MSLTIRASKLVNNVFEEIFPFEVMEKTKLVLDDPNDVSSDGHFIENTEHVPDTGVNWANGHAHGVLSVLGLGDAMEDGMFSVDINLAANKALDFVSRLERFPHEVRSELIVNFGHRFSCAELDNIQKDVTTLMRISIKGQVHGATHLTGA